MCSHLSLFVHPSQRAKCHYIILIITKLSIILSWCWNCRECGHMDRNISTHTHTHTETSLHRRFRTIFTRWRQFLPDIWFLPGWTPGKSAFLCEGDRVRNCFKCHLPSAKQISLFSAATWRKQNIKSGLKVMSVVLLTFLSVGWQRLALSFSALHLYYSCNTQGWKSYWVIFPVSPQKWMMCHGHTELRENYSRQEVSASLFRIFAVKLNPRLSVLKGKKKKSELLLVWLCFEKGIAAHRDKALPSGQVVLTVRSG